MQVAEQGSEDENGSQESFHLLRTHIVVRESGY